MNSSNNVTLYLSNKTEIESQDDILVRQQYKEKIFLLFTVLIFIFLFWTEVHQYSIIGKCHFTLATTRDIQPINNGALFPCPLSSFHVSNLGNRNILPVANSECDIKKDRRCMPLNLESIHHKSSRPLFLREFVLPSGFREVT